MYIKTYKDLLVWQKSMDLVKELYKLTAQFPEDEKFGLKSQMERASVSIVSQIAEGHMRKHRKEYVHFLSISLGSAAELETQILVCKSLDKFNDINFSKIELLLEEILKMLYVMIRRLDQLTP